MTQQGGTSMGAALVAIAIQEAPAVIQLLREAFIKKNPNLPSPTSEEVIAAYRQAFNSSLSKDAAWLAAHPQQ